MNENINNRDPLSETLYRLTCLDDHLHTDIGPVTLAFLPVTDLLDNTKPALKETLDQYLTLYSAPDPRTGATFFLGDYAGSISAAAVATYLSERRAPDLSAANMAVCFHTQTGNQGVAVGRLDVRLLSGCFGCLPDDPDANHPNAVVLPDETALLDWMRGKLVGHLLPLIIRVIAVAHLNSGAWWRLVENICTTPFIHRESAHVYANTGD